MTDDILDDEDFQPPGKADFRRVGRGTPFVVDPAGKRTRYGRPSNAGKILDDESNLTDWKLRTTVVGSAQRPDLMALVSTLDPQADKKQLRDIAEECLVSGKGKERTVKGTAIHSMFDHVDRDDDWVPAPQWLDLCNSYREALKLWGLLPVDIEIHCINDAFRLAGSMDRRYRTTKVLVAPDGTTVPIGSMLAADTKTGSTLEYASGSYATQLAAYADSDRYNVETDERQSFSPPTFEDWGLIVHADSASIEVQFFWVDLNAGREGLQLAQQVKRWRQRSDLLTLAAGPILLTSAPVPQEAPTVPQEATRVLGLLQHTRDRVKAVLAHSEVAGKALQRNWPEGIPGLKAGGLTWDDLQQVIASVEKVEKDYSVPFFPQWVDSSVDASKLRHPSNSWVNPMATVRHGLVDQWMGEAIIAAQVADALTQFASINTAGWPTSLQTIEEQLTCYLDGTLRALGFMNGIQELNRITADDAPRIISAAIAITTGTGQLMYQEDGTAVFRTNIVKG